MELEHTFSIEMDILDSLSSLQIKQVNMKTTVLKSSAKKIK